MEVSRRSFLKRGLLLGSGTMLSGVAGTAMTAPTKKIPYKLRDVQETLNICCYCAGGCGLICSSRGGELINLEGDPEHPVNLGGLCPNRHVGPSQYRDERTSVSESPCTRVASDGAPSWFQGMDAVDLGTGHR